MKNYHIIITTLLIAFVFLSCSNDSTNEITLAGTIEAVESTISSKVGGEILELLVNEGTQVKAGDLLAIIDHTDYELQYRQLAAGARAAEAQYLLLERGTRKEDLQQAEESLKQAEANLENAKQDFKRIENLFTSGSVSIKQMDDVKTRLELTQAQYNSAKQLVEKLRVGPRSEEIASAKARFEQASAQADALKKKINDCNVQSPIDGYVTKRLVEKGELVNLGTPLFRIADLSEMYIMVYLSETKLGLVKLGNKADIRIDSFPDKKFVGEVIFISPEAEFTPKNIQTKEERIKLVFGVKLKIPNPDYVLKTGVPADVIIRTGE